MRLNKKYKLTLEDESSLEKKLNFSARLHVWIIIIVAITVCAGAFGMFILAATPLKNHLPGYLKKSERTATEEQHLRLDSLVHVFEKNEAYISSILDALNPPAPVASDKKEKKGVSLSPDSLIQASEEEKNFMEYIRERDKYNVAYVSPAAAQTLMFGNVNKAAVITDASKEKYQTDIILPTGSAVSSIAEGKVISVASSPRASGGFEVIIQHPKGFVSKTSRLSNLMVRPGDRVASGQIIAEGTSKAGLNGNHVVLELWHDGDPILPARYLNSGAFSSKK